LCQRGGSTCCLLFAIVSLFWVHSAALAIDIESAPLVESRTEDVLSLGEENDGVVVPSSLTPALLDDTHLNAMMNELEMQSEHQENAPTTLKTLPAETYIEIPKESITHATQAQSVTLRVLNKITARSTTVQVNVGRRTHVDAIEMSVLQCQISGEEPMRETKALLQIAELKPDQEPIALFYGWMLGRSSSISSLEHPMYDVTLVSCQ
jgi:hypothetical protein